MNTIELSHPSTFVTCHADSGLPAIILPGGGYRTVADGEAGPIAEMFANAGYRPYVLHYSVSDSPLPFDGTSPLSFAPIQELAEAMGIVSAQNGGSRIILCGFSAGAHLGFAYSALRTDDMPKAGALALIYPATRFRLFEAQGVDLFESLSPAFPPTFLVHGQNDAMVNPSGTLELAARLNEFKVPCEFHFYEDFPHARPMYKPEWFTLLFDWLKIRV